MHAVDVVSYLVLKIVIRSMYITAYNMHTKYRTARYVAAVNRGAEVNRAATSNWRMRAGLADKGRRCERYFARIQ